MRYNDQSPLEHMHLAVTFSLLRREGSSFLTQETLSHVRSVLVKAVLGTDMANHGETMTRLDALIANLRHRPDAAAAGAASEPPAAAGPPAPPLTPWYAPPDPDSFGVPCVVAIAAVDAAAVCRGGGGGGG